MPDEVRRAEEVLGEPLLARVLGVSGPRVLQGYLAGYALPPERARRMVALDRALWELLKRTSAEVALDLLGSASLGSAPLDLLAAGQLSEFELAVTALLAA